MTTRTLDSFDFPKIPHFTFSKNVEGSRSTVDAPPTDSASDRSRAAKREDRDGMVGRFGIWLDFL